MVPLALAALTMNEKVARVWADLRDIADRLYGTEADLWTLTRLPDRHPKSAATRRLLQCWFGLVQEPITGVWLWMSEPRGGDPSHETAGAITAAEECERDEQPAGQP